jgi:hypothetical protein
MLASRDYAVGDVVLQSEAQVVKIKKSLIDAYCS